MQNEQSLDSLNDKPRYWFECSKICVLDLETENYSTYGRISNPFDPRNKIIAASYIERFYKVENPTSLLDCYGPIKVDYNRNGIKFLALDWSQIDLLVGQNIGFDLLYLWHDPAFRKWLSNGGLIFDTQIMEYLLTGQETLYASLNGLARKYNGFQKDDQIAEAWKRGVLTSQIDPDLLIPYAKGDIYNTAHIFAQQWVAAQQSSIKRLSQSYMDHILAICEMEFNGVRYDPAIAQKALEEQGLLVSLEKAKVTLSELAGELAKQNQIPEFNFNMNSKPQMHSILFGLPLKHKYQQVLGIYGEKAKKAGEVRKVWRKGVFLFEGLGFPLKLGENPKPKILKSGQEATLPLVDKNVLEKCAEFVKGHAELVHKKAGPFITSLLTYRKIFKLISTYVNGYIPLVNAATGVIHHSLNCVSTVTGRLSSNNPNMQNVPRNFRKAFISRYENGCILEFDYASLEIVLGAWLAGCSKLLNDLEAGVDFHLKRAGLLEQLTYEEVCQAAIDHPEEWKRKRQIAKAISYGKQYGGMAERIARNSGLDEELVDQVIQSEANEYPELKEYQKRIEEEVHLTFKLTSETLPIWDKDAKQRVAQPTGSLMRARHVGYFKTVTGKIYSFKEYATTSKKLRDNGKPVYSYIKPTEMANYPVQGTAADIVANRASKVFRYLLEHPEIECKLINEIHDSIVFDCKSREVAERLIPDITKIMENTQEVFNSFGYTKDFPLLKVEAKYGPYWGGTYEV